MSESICNFIPKESYPRNIKTVHFVYESDFVSLKQPFICPIYYIYLVTAGNGTLRIYDKEYPLECGTIFFAFPGVPFTIDADESFKYLYISFMGECVPNLLKDFGISRKSCVYPDYSLLIDFWMSSITRVNSYNASILSESILLYSLSFLGGENNNETEHTSDNFFDMLLDYVGAHYYEHDICIKKLAQIFSYTEKYISYLFKTKMNVGFSKYLNRLRIRHACDLISQNMTSVSEIAFNCGFSDSLYFSKVFKKITGISPTEYIKSRS